ncbi:MAG: hypothetical protein RR880_03905, partial [Bacteroidales bacterium]
LAAFPESERWLTPKGANSGYLLAMFAIQIGGCPGTRLFGVELLYQLMKTIIFQQQMADCSAEWYAIIISVAHRQNKLYYVGKV